MRKFWVLLLILIGFGWPTESSAAVNGLPPASPVRVVSERFGGSYDYGVTARVAEAVGRIKGRDRGHKQQVRASRTLGSAWSARFDYDPSERVHGSRFGMATETGGEAGTGADSHGGGKNAQHGDGGRRAQTLEQQIQEAKDQLAELNRTQGPKRDKVKLGNKIRNLEQEARDAARGENHSQRPKR